jgi:hypothetical protein
MSTRDPWMDLQYKREGDESNGPHKNRDYYCRMPPLEDLKI